MYLKKLDVQGFKSFADRTSLEFNSGITSVVGPNGSGKSNIADAIRWVLGEGSAKALRGSKMEDVIFSGTEHRKPLGFAEVSIVIDNSDGALPVEYSEVVITRRMYRSGESEFFINKTSCRLKDITQLLLDTGVGKDGYSVIGQGRVDEILSTRSEDRRMIFEEASGIMKYKLRKIEAERKLEHTRQNLLRINDIIFELEGQIEPLGRQAETAKKYLSLREKLKELEVNVYIENISKLKEKSSELEEKFKLIKENIEEENQKLKKLASENELKSDLQKELEEKLENSRQEFHRLESLNEKYNADIRLNEEKISGLNKNIERIDNEIKEFGEKDVNLEEDISKKRGRISYLKKQYEDFSSKLEKSQKRMEELISELDEGEKYIERLKTEVMDKYDMLSDKKIHINDLKTNIESIEKRQRSIEKEIQALTLECDRERVSGEDLHENITNTNKAINDLNNKIKTLLLKKKEASDLLDRERKALNNLREEYHSKATRKKMLVEMEKNFEGYSRSVREVLKACRTLPEFGKGIRGALAQIIEVEAKYETAVEMALGGALQNIVTENEEDAKKAIEFLKKEHMGRATFLPISTVKERCLHKDAEHSVKSFPGFCGIASELVVCSPEYKGIISNLLGRVVVAANLESAIKMARHFKYSFKIVTLDGDILNTSGAMTGGSAEKSSAGILSRNREIIELVDAVRQLEQGEKNLSISIEEIVKGIESIDKEIADSERELKNNELIKIRDESHLAQIRETISKTNARIEMLRQEKEQLSRQEQGINKEMQKYSEELCLVEKEINEAKKVIEQHQKKHRETQSERDNLHADITDFKIAVNSITESLRNVEEDINRITGEKESLKAGIDKKFREKARCAREIEELKSENEVLKQKINTHEQESKGKTFEIDRILEERRVLEDELKEINQSLTDINKNLLLLQEEYSRIEVRKAKNEVETEAIQNRLWDEYELTYANAMEYKKDIGGMGQAQRKIEEYKAQIRELGVVNVAAIEEYAKTKERFEFMTEQKNDMEQAEKKLQRVIAEMISIMKRQFMEQFKKINENFNIVFRELFDGGRASLILEDDENVLESGIDIEAQPPGKKLQNLMLLSGGERALTAIALLFAILRLKPTPFCVLDEIEAALDEANVYRFSQYLRRFSEQTQFIMITHRKGTMEGSDVLYGVTMEERGISKIVSMKMDESKAG